MDMPKLTEHHKKLEKLPGRWHGTETMRPSQWDPEGGTATGRNDNRLALNGFALITDYEQERDGAITFSGHGVMTYDTNEGCYVLHWFDSMGSPPEVFKGNFDGDVLTMSHGGPGMHARFTYDFSREGILGCRMDMSKDGTEWATFFECDYERQ
ncbi:DUF1579 domain-containing protein [bacterium]|nr:DUF1579 domain-containing protein [bacterium]